MKFFRLTLIAAAFSMLASCAAPVTRRIEHNPEIYAKLSEKHKQNVLAGKVEEGMSKEGVFLAWGPPSRVAKGTSGGKPLEKWVYTGERPIFRQNYGFGWGAWGRGYCGYYDPYIYTGPSVEYVPFDAAHVDFVGGRVTAWATSGQ
ncbi:MAG: hypothetical protein H7A55_02050 [Verrucomicrobiaceae bacterium]|nr:hypothetical protein [Verrucomicrobiaceae bacterium]